ncbi:MAG: molybdopterin molybdenumtransferase MoeA [Candidimonas sp.]|nr:MAG: molybdopterin molybdenumtransferase MoeA [Candidimonas sp.]TAM23434.1 MAG: molybdopterin molybdenumtransferase MoeA [Candidimonas sp.]
MLDFDIAQLRLAQAGKRPDATETCPLYLAAGRVLAQPVVATLDLPPADNSAMDGYAIHYADYHAGRKFPVQQRCFAGVRPQALQDGQTIRLFTGSLMPEGADTVVMQEDCTEADNLLEIGLEPKCGAHVRRQGEDVRKGDVLLGEGTRLEAAHIALLASQGLVDLPVYPQLKVGILTTGDELTFPGQPRRNEQIFNSNGPMLAALVDQLGARVVHVLHALDTRSSLKKALTTLLKDCDLILTVGGVSVGEKDLVKPAIEQAGGTLDLWRVCMKPGKPVALAHARNKPIVCLPGNPVSAFSVFALLVSPLIRSMQGRCGIVPPVQFGCLKTAREFKETREEFLRVRAAPTAQSMPELIPYDKQGSGIISSLPWASGFARIRVNTVVKDGDIVPYYDYRHWLA